MRKFLSTIAAAGALTLGAAAATPAAAIDFIGNWSVDYYNGWTEGLNLGVSDDGGTLGDPTNGFPLNGVGPGNGNVFDTHLFDLWADELVSWPNDYDTQPITVNFEFTQPDIVGGVGGSTYGESDGHIGWFGIPYTDTFGQVTWGGPQTFDFGNNGVLNVLVYSVGGWNDHGTGTFNFTKWASTEVRAKFWVDPMPSAVPEPTTWALMITGFGLAGAALRRRRSAGAVAA